MPYPASVLTKRGAVDRLDRDALRSKRVAIILRDKTADGEVERRLFINLRDTLSQQIYRINEIATINGIGAVIIDEKDSFVGDPVAEAQAMRSAAVTLRDWMHSKLDGVPLYGPPDEDGVRHPLTFTTAQTAEFRTHVDTFAATIN